MNSAPVFEWFVYQQDYLWFLTAFGWAVLLDAWRRLGRSDQALSWLPTGAGAALLIASLEVSQLVTPVELKPFAAPWLAWDLALGGVQAGLAGGLWWTYARSKAWAPWKGALLVWLSFAAAAARYSYSVMGSLALALMVFAAVWALVRSRVFSTSGRVALLGLAAAVLFATNGPIAESSGFPHRYTQINPFGIAASLSLLAAAIAAGTQLYRQVGLVVSAPITQSDLRSLIRAQTLWLLLGLALAALMSKWARTGFESNLLARVHLSTELIDKQYLESHLGPEFRVNDVWEQQSYTGEMMPTFRSRYLAKHKLVPLTAELARIELANRDVDWAIVVTMRDGWLVQYAFSSRMPSSEEKGTNGTYGRPDVATWDFWSRRQAQVFAPITLFYGTVVQARAPLLSSQGRMLGWLLFDEQVAHWLAAQVQARLLAFIVIALGSALLVVNWQQRLRERLRAAVRREADAALAANQVKAAFLAKVSHELRTPIQSLLGYSELLRQRVADDPKAAGWLAALRQHGELMTRLVNDLIDLGAVETGAFRLVPRAVEPGNLVSQAVESFRPRAENKQLTLACFIDPTLPECVSLDGERFRQVLTNLVANAIKFTDRGGVTVALRAEAGDRLVLTVRDTGPGIPPAEQGRLFVAFSRLELTADKEGSGLGLALSAALCQAMGGELKVASDGVAGSCFTASARAPTAQLLAPAHPAEAVSTLRGKRVLVVDDNPLVRELFIAFLTDQGALCAAAATGAEALAHAGTSEFNAIILDLALPDGDGTQFVQPLRERIDGARIIGVSAHASSADRERAMAIGMDAFLTKPVPLGALATAIANEPAGQQTNLPVFRTADALRERLARQFMRELPAQRQELGTALTAGEWPRVRAIAHYLKNSAVVVRDDALFDVCTGLEQAAEERNEAAAGHWWARCTPHFERWSKLPPSSLSSAAS